VVICAVIVYFTEESFAKYVDPALSIISAVVLLILSYPYSKYIPLVRHGPSTPKQFHYWASPCKCLAVHDAGYLPN
jgi:hypothetical protein